MMLQAILADPTHGLPHVACCISMGRMALFSDNKGKVALAKTAREQAVVALQKEPQSDLAHHLMGRQVAAALRPWLECVDWTSVRQISKTLPSLTNTCLNDQHMITLERM